jgi:mercuric ion transport protein
MTNARMAAVGLIGGMAAVLCCFTPVLTLLLGVVGLSAWIGYLDYVLFPAMLIFAGIVVYALLRRKPA